MKKFLLLFVAFFCVMGMNASSYKETLLDNIKSTDELLIVTQIGDEFYAWTTLGGSSKSPTIVKVAVKDGVVETTEKSISWSITNDGGYLTINAFGSENYMYLTNSNTGIRVGSTSTTNASEFTYGTTGLTAYYLCGTDGTNARILGIYNKTDVRCYKPYNDGPNSNISGQSTKFYVKQITNDPVISCGDIDFGKIGVGAMNVTTVDVVGEKLEAAINASFAAGDKFTVTPSIDAAGGQLTITCTAETAGVCEGTLTLTSGATTKVVKVKANVLTLEGKGTKESPLTINDLVALDNNGKDVWVIGYMRGVTVTKNNKATFSTNIGTTSSNVALTQSLDVTVEDSVIASVQLLASTEAREKLNLVDNLSLIDHQVKVFGSLISYNTTYGVKNTSDYEIVGSVKKGDVNNDGAVNVGDITKLVTLIMDNYSTPGELFDAADLNEDTTLNVGDLTTLITVVMSAE